MAFCIQHFCTISLVPSLGDLRLLHTFIELRFCDLAQLCFHHTMHDAMLNKASYLFSNYPARLKGNGNRRNVNVDTSLLDSSLWCWRFGGFTDTGDSSSIDGLVATQDRREGEYEGYCCHEILLKRSKWSSERTFLGDSRND